MKNVLLVCSTALSTSMLVSKMEKSAETMNFDIKVWSCGDSDLEKNVTKADIILLGPQVRYLFDEVTKLVDERKSVLLIDVNDYRSMNTRNILEKCLYN